MTLRGRVTASPRPLSPEPQTLSSWLCPGVPHTGVHETVWGASPKVSTGGLVVSPHCPDTLVHHHPSLPQECRDRSQSKKGRLGLGLTLSSLGHCQPPMARGPVQNALSPVAAPRPDGTALRSYGEAGPGPPTGGPKGKPPRPSPACLWADSGALTPLNVPSVSQHRGQVRGSECRGLAGTVARLPSGLGPPEAGVSLEPLPDTPAAPRAESGLSSPGPECRTADPWATPRGQAHLSEARRLPLPNRLRMEREAGSLASRE